MPVAYRPHAPDSRALSTYRLPAGGRQRLRNKTECAAENVDSLCSAAPNAACVEAGSGASNHWQEVEPGSAISGRFQKGVAGTEGDEGLVLLRRAAVAFAAQGHIDVIDREGLRKFAGG